MRNTKGAALAPTSPAFETSLSSLSFHQQSQTDFLSVRTATEIERLYSKHFFSLMPCLIVLPLILLICFY